MQKKAQREDQQTKRLLEAGASIVGALLACATLGIIVWNGIAGGDTPPVIAVEPTGVHEHGNGFVLEIIAANRGGETASEIVIEGTLTRDGEIAEASQTTFPFLPERAERRGGLFFSADPRDYDVSVRALGYVDP